MIEMTSVVVPLLHNIHNLHFIKHCIEKHNRGRKPEVYDMDYSKQCLMPDRPPTSKRQKYVKNTLSVLNISGRLQEDITESTEDLLYS